MTASIHLHMNFYAYYITNEDAVQSVWIYFQKSSPRQFAEGLALSLLSLEKKRKCSRAGMRSDYVPNVVYVNIPFPKLCVNQSD